MVAYKADTSAEICMKFIEKESVHDCDLAIIDHIDMDGIMSVFTLLHREYALKHREVIVGAANMGDFWGWAPIKSQILYQGMTFFVNKLQEVNTDIQEVYSLCCDKTIDLIEGVLSPEEEMVVQDGISCLAESVRKIEEGEVVRTVRHPHFVHYHISDLLTEEQLEQALTMPEFNGLLNNRIWLHPHARNKIDREKVQLVSMETENGWYYDMWYPGYMWAETPESWNAPGLLFTGRRDTYLFDFPPLTAAIQELNQLESGTAGRWLVTSKFTPSLSLKGRASPVVVSFQNANHEQVPSHIPPEQVADQLAAVFV